MRALLDTHTLLWMAEDALELSSGARSVLSSENTEIYFSVASVWEICIKVGLGKLPLRRPLGEFVELLENHPYLVSLPLTHKHCLRQAALPLHHRDPFDRLLIAQAMSENLTVVGNDAAFDAYDVPRIW